jgi:hypothetical protein
MIKLNPHYHPPKAKYGCIMCDKIAAHVGSATEGGATIWFGLCDSCRDSRPDFEIVQALEMGKDDE